MQSIDEIQAAVQSCATSSDAPLMVYVSKMVAVPAAALPRQPGGAAVGGAPADDQFLAFGRVFSGELRDGQTVHVLSAAYDPSEPASHQQEVQVRPQYCVLPAKLIAVSPAAHPSHYQLQADSSTGTNSAARFVPAV